MPWEFKTIHELDIKILIFWVKIEYLQSFLQKSERLSIAVFPYETRKNKSRLEIA